MGMICLVSHISPFSLVQKYAKCKICKVQKMQSAKYAKCKNMQSAKIFKVQKYANIWVKQRAEISLMECGVLLEGPEKGVRGLDERK